MEWDGLAVCCMSVQKAACYGVVYISVYECVYVLMCICVYTVYKGEDIGESEGCGQKRRDRGGNGLQ